LSDTTLTSIRSPLSPDVEVRFRGFVKQLPSNAIAKELVDVFFSEANWYFGVLERYYFDKLHNSWYAVSDAMAPKGEFGNILRDLQYFPALLFQVLAVALQYLPPNTTSARVLHLEDPAACDRLSEEYSRLGVDIMALLGRHNSSLTAVQQDLMRALWLKNCSRGTESWYSLGDAIREAPSSVSSKKCTDILPLDRLKIWDYTCNARFTRKRRMMLEIRSPGSGTTSIRDDCGSLCSPGTG
jgi:Fungal specific transcription factor domain